MPKFDPYKPPMSLQESERLLRDADQQASMNRSFKLTLALIPAGLLLLVFVLCLIYGVSGLAGIFSRLF